MSFRTTLLGDFVDVNPEGITKAYPHDEILYIDISSVGSGHFVESPKPLSLNDAPSRAKRIVRDGDTILATVRPNLRSFLFIREPEANTIASTGFAVLRAKENADSRFIYYAVTDQGFTGYLTNNTKGTSYPAVDTDTVLRGEIPDYNLQRQQAIASTLSTYDDLIENNRRRIQLLEQAARLLYKEWFVHLRFPGHEHVKIKACPGYRSGNGVPEGWDQRELGEIATVKKGKNITRETVIEGNVPVVAGGLKPAYYHSEANSAGPVITVSASGANAGHVSLYHKGIWASDCSYLSESDNPEIWYLYLAMKDRQAEITGMQQGAAQPHVYPKHLKRLTLLIPPRSLRNLLSETIEANFLQIANLEKQIEKLAKTRDYLLPKLMNGELTV